MNDDYIRLCMTMSKDIMDMMRDIGNFTVSDLALRINFENITTADDSFSMAEAMIEYLDAYLDRNGDVFSLKSTPAITRSENMELFRNLARV